MATWESIEAFAFGDIQFLADGSIDAGEGGSFPQSARFDNLTVGEVTLNKPSGESGELISVDSSEASLVTRWDGHHWHVKKELDPADNSRTVVPDLRRIPTAPAAPVLPEVFLPQQPSSPATRREPLSANLIALIATAISILVILVITLIVMREPIAVMMDKWHEDAEIRRVNKGVATDREQAARKLKTLHEAAHELSDRVKQAIGRSLERIAEAPYETPAEITKAIRTDDAFNDIWDEIGHAYPTTEEFASWQATLDDIAARLNANSARDTDQESLQSLGETLDRRSAALAALHEHVDVLGKILTLRRSEKRFSDPERKPPP